jgi:uncharacterized membrane protein YdbT with pleckstrin-like domain
VAENEILYQGIARHSASIGGYIRGGVVCFLGGVAAWLLGKIDALADVHLWPLIFIGIPMITLTYFRHTTTKYKVTTVRVETEKGILSKTLDTLELWRVLDIKYSQSVLDRILGNASIVLIGTDQSDPELNLHGLPDHRALFEKLRDAVQEARRRGRPMEMVGGEGFGEMV